MNLEEQEQAMLSAMPAGLTGDAVHVAAIEAYAAVTGCMPSESPDTDAAWRMVERVGERYALHQEGDRVRHIWTGETGVVVASWLWAMRVQRDEGGVCQDRHDRWERVTAAGAGGHR